MSCIRGFISQKCYIHQLMCLFVYSPFTQMTLFSSILRQRFHTKHNQLAIAGIAFLIQQFITQQIAGQSWFAARRWMPGITVGFNGALTSRHCAMPDYFLWPKREKQIIINKNSVIYVYLSKNIPWNHFNIKRQSIQKTEAN